MTATVASGATDVAVKAGQKAVNKTTDLVSKSTEDVEGVGAATKKAGKVVKTGSKVAGRGIKTAKTVALFALRQAIRALRAIIRVVDGILGALFAYSTIIAVVCFMVVLLIISACSGVVPILLTGGGTSKTSLQSLMNTTSVSTSADKDKIDTSADEGVTASKKGWSTKGKCSVPHYVQKCAGGRTEELAFRDKMLKAHKFTDGSLFKTGTYTGDWGNFWYKGVTNDIETAGCGACAMANAISGQLNKEITPDIVVNYLNSQGGIGTTRNANLCAEALAKKYAKDGLKVYNLDGTDVLKSGANYTAWLSGEYGRIHTVSPSDDCTNVLGDLSKKVDEWLDKGACLVFSIDKNSDVGGRFRYDGHFICCYGRDSKGYYVTDSGGFVDTKVEKQMQKAGKDTREAWEDWYIVDVPYTKAQVFSGGVQGPFVFINKSKMK